jgi:hypothetical protein
LRTGQHGRSLKTCTGCGPYCVVGGTGCVIKGRRRLVGEDVPKGTVSDIAQEPSPSGQRHLGQCDGDIAAIAASLDALSPNLTSECRSLINSPRNITCVQTTENCFIESFNLWDARNGFIMASRFTGGSFCRRKMVSFEAKTNYYLGKIQFVVRGPGNYFTNRTEHTAPYFLTGNNDKGAPFGTTFVREGDYTLTATSMDDSKRAKTISFQVRNC